MNRPRSEVDNVVRPEFGKRDDFDEIATDSKDDSMSAPDSNRQPPSIWQIAGVVIAAVGILGGLLIWILDGIRTDIRDVRIEIDVVRTELGDEIGAVRTEIGDVRDRVHDLQGGLNYIRGRLDAPGTANPSADPDP